MDFSLSDDQQALGALTRQICAGHITAERRKTVDAQPVRFDRDLWRELAAAGVVGAGLPESVGGGGFDFIEQCTVLIEIGRAVAAVPYLPVTTTAATIAHFGTDGQRRRWAAPAVRGELVLVTALAEEFADSLEAPLTRATSDGSRFELSGSKALVPFAGVADAFLVSASTADGAALFVVLPTDDGVTLTPQQVLDGDHESALELDRVSLDADRLIATGDVPHWLLVRTTVGLAAYQVGVLERALELTAAYAREREQFGRRIGSFQAVAQRLADAYIDVEAARLTMWEAAWRIAEGLSCPTEVATAKFWAADAGHRVAHTAVHVHGGTGIDLDGEVHRYFTAAKRTEFTLGHATAQLRRIGAELAATPA